MATNLVPPICQFCSRYKPGVSQPDETSRCEAFPDGIPGEILDDLFDHRKQLFDEQFLFDPNKLGTPDMIQKWADAADMMKRIQGGDFSVQ